MRSLFGITLAAVSLSFAAGCAGMIVGSPAWFERQKPDVQPMAAADLQCSDKPIEYAAVSSNDYREVEARGCGKKARYQLIKVGPIQKWSKSSDVTPM
jgi:hypothetical protein